MHKLYYDRTCGQMGGALTLGRVEGNQLVKIFERLPVRSGQPGYLDGGKDDWVRGKGATPFGRHWLKCTPVALQFSPKHTPFHLIATRQGYEYIQAKGSSQFRHMIGLHLENDYPGSAGCPVLLHDTPERECLSWALLKYLERLAKYEPYVQFTVL